MDNLQLHVEVMELKKLREKQEDQLKMIAFEMCDLPDDVSALLDECVELQMDTQLHDLSENYLQEFYYTKQKEVIDNLHTITKLKAEIKQLKEMIESEKEECSKLEKFTTIVNNRLISEAEMMRVKIALENTMQGLENRQKSLPISGDLNVDDLINKVEILKKINKSKEK